MPVTKAEDLVLDEVLAAMREAKRTGCQLSITFDYFAAGGGLNLSVMLDPRGFSLSVEGEFRGRRGRRRPTARHPGTRAAKKRRLRT